MAKGGRRFGAATVPWFNGGLFNDDDVLNLGPLGIADLATVAGLDWSAIEPFIFGTLFERGLDPATRRDMAMLFDAAAQNTPQAALFGFAAAENRAGVGIHYTDPQTISKIIDPVVLRPLAMEWNQLKGMAGAMGAGNIEREYISFREKLAGFRVLDPACGSGNFLALALSALKDFDLRVRQEAARIGLPSDPPRVGPQSVLGIEIDPYAAELARLTVWITELQWEIRNGFPIKRTPILGALDGIVRRDALLNEDGSRAGWPAADVVIGNPPFVGSNLLRGKLTSGYVERLFAAYANHVPAHADLVSYWFTNAWEGIKAGRHKRAGLVATNSIRDGASRRILDRISREGTIFEAWDDEQWVIDGAAVRVSLICFAREASNEGVQLDGRIVQRINPDLTETIDLTAACRLRENRGASFQGPVLVGNFDIPGELAREWLQSPLNPNGISNANVFRPLRNGRDLTTRPRDRWVIDFNIMSEHEAALFEKPFEYIRVNVKPVRIKNRRAGRALSWWKHGETGVSMWRAINPLKRYIGCSQVAKHRVFTWLHPRIQPHQTVIVITRDDDATLGVLQSRYHRAWALRLGSSLEDRPRYTPSTTFETFPFPDGLTPHFPAAAHANDARAMKIAAAAARLNDLREAWLNPANLVERTPEMAPGFPERILPVDGDAAAVLRRLTITNLYNKSPTWLNDAHYDLDTAVAEAYGWPGSISEDEAIGRLLELNLSRHLAQTREV